MITLLKKYPLALSLFGISLLLNFYGRALYQNALEFIPREHFIAILFMVTLACCTSSYMSFPGFRNIVRGYARRFATRYRKEKAPFILLCIYAVLSFGALVWAVQLQEEYFHLMIYSSLGLLIAHESRTQKNAWIIVTVGGFSLANELIQAILPYRIFDIRDIFIDTLASSLGVCLYRIFSRAKTQGAS